MDIPRFPYIDDRSTEVADSVKEPAQWDIAIHHYDARTNSGQVIETASTDIDGVVSSKEYSDSVFTKDIWTTDNIIVDLSQMITGSSSMQFLL